MQKPKAITLAPHLFADPPFPFFGLAAASGAAVCVLSLTSDLLRPHMSGRTLVNKGKRPVILTRYPPVINDQSDQSSASSLNKDAGNPDKLGSGLTEYQEYRARMTGRSSR